MASESIHPSEESFILPPSLRLQPEEGMTPHFSKEPPILPPPEKSASLWRRVTDIPKGVLEICRDSQWTQLLTEMMGLAAQICETQGGHAHEAIPFLAALVAPFSLPNALRSAYERLRMVKAAAKTQYYAQMLFWGARAIDCLGAVVGNVSKSLVGGFNILGVGSYVSGVLFTLIFPIILVIVGAIAGIAQGCFLWKNARALKNLNEKERLADQNLKVLVELLDYVQGPKAALQKEGENVDHLAQERLMVEQQIYQDSHFSNETRMQAMQKRIEALLTEHDIHEIVSLREKILTLETTHTIQNKLKEAGGSLQPDSTNPQTCEALSLLKEIESLYGKLLESDHEISTMDEMISFYEKMPSLFSQPSLQTYWDKDRLCIDQLQSDLGRSQQELVRMRQTYVSTGKEAISHMRSELHRTLLVNATLLLIAALVFTSGVLSLSSSKYHLVTSVLSFSSTGLGVACLLLDKHISHDQFHRLQAFFS